MEPKISSEGAASQSISSNLFEKLRTYKKKYYSNQLLKGSILFLSLILGTFLFINALEYFGRFNPIVRAILFFAFVSVVLTSLAYWLVNPIVRLYVLKRQISNEEAARQIGNHFTSIDDKLLNTLQLNSLSHERNELLKASIEQKIHQLSVVRFTDAIDIRENNRYLKYIFVPAALIVFILILYPHFFTETSTRIVNFNDDYAEPAPFRFSLLNQSLTAFKDEDFPINLSISGGAITEFVYLVSNGRRYRMESANSRRFAHSFNRVQRSFSFHFEAAGYHSTDYSVNVIERPNLKFFDASLSYPSYLSKKDETLSNVGNLVIPDGTLVRWKFNASGTDSLFVGFEEASLLVANRNQKNSFEFTKRMRKSENYQVHLKSQFSHNRDKISYYVSVIPDKFPQVSLEHYQDTALFNYLVLGGNIMDDYGISQLKVFYRAVHKGNKLTNYIVKNLEFDRKQSIQNFYHQLGLEDLSLKAGDKLQYYVQVWDNDGVNGSKSAKTQPMEFNIPSEQAMEDNIRSSTKRTESRLSSTIDQVQKLKKDMKSLENRLKNKKTMDFQDKKLVEDLLKKREELMKEVESIQKESKLIQEKQQKFNEQSQEIAEKAEQLNKLMSELLDEETKKLYEELQKLLEQNRTNTDALDLLNKIDKKENNLKKELERALEMFKQLQFDQKVEDIAQDLKKEADKQKELSEESIDKNQNKPALENQQQLNEEFKKTQEELKELEKMNGELENPQEMGDTQEQQKEILEEQKKSLDQLQQKQNRKASDSQKKAAKKLNEMSDKLSEMQQEEEMQQVQENMDDLRNILENLLTLSFDQEKLMKDFREVNQSDPRFIKLSQQQLKLKDDAKIVEDSLNSLAKRVFQIESFVTREVGAMNQYMDQSLEAIKQRRINTATGKQQFSMTSLNNLALMLNDVLKQMQEQIANAQPSSGKSKKKGKPQSTGLSELQKKLNGQIQQLQQGNKTGRQLSEELSRLAMEQEMIRKALKELENTRKGNLGGKEGTSDQVKELAKQMEETEKELVNKKLSPNMIKRQQDIFTRLLESEKALRERDEDDKRKAEAAKEKQIITPPQFEEYILNKQKQIELLKTVPPSLSPYYKKEVDRYFNKIRLTK